MKLKPKHWRIAGHYARWVDKRWFPDFQLTKQIIHSFFLYESCGGGAISKKERDSISPLIGEEDKPGQIRVDITGKPAFELQKHMVLTELYTWWSKGWGWRLCIISDIEYEFKHRHSIKNTTWIKELIQIVREFEKDRFSYLNSLCGSIFTREEINKFYNTFLNRCDT